MSNSNSSTSRIRRTNQQIMDLLKEFLQSGLSVVEFGSLHNIHPATIGKWKSRYLNTKSDSADSGGFTRISITEPSASSVLFAEVNGIKIFQPVSASFLKELLA